ncbi:MAG: copper amine oxidase N-terminal domain-containing protein [Clostridiales bacterium]|jgi:hypothetical protein|nr:copper amine oxidase N-terminal domain-containing protein [Clostridiales bacterium]
MRKLAALLFVLCLTLMPIHFETSEADTQTGVIIAVNNKQLQLSNAPLKVDDRVMGPMREIMQQLGATFVWAQNSRQLSIYGESRYVILTIGSNVMHSGVYRADETGTFLYETKQELTLDLAPRMVNDHVYAPVRPIAEALGAKVNWDAGRQIQFIYTQQFLNQTSDSMLGATDITSGGVVFQEIAASTAQRWYDVSNTFMLIYYSSLSESSRVVLDYASKSAKDFGLRLYGVDIDSPNYNNTTGRLTFIWDYMERDGANNLPALFFVTGQRDVTPLIQPRDHQSIDFCVTAYYYLLLGQTPGLPAIYTPSSLWKEITRTQAMVKYANNEKFIYVCYNSTDDTSNALTPMIKLAAAKSNTKVFTTDCAGFGESGYWFGVDALNGKSLSKYPTIFFVFGRGRIPYACVQPGDINEVLAAFTNFSK